MTVTDHQFGKWKSFMEENHENLKKSRTKSCSSEERSRANLLLSASSARPSVLER